MSRIIGITASDPNAAGEVGLGENYIACVRRAGAVPVLLPPGETEVGAVLGRLDGLVLAGGGDLDPVCYGGAKHPAVYLANGDRDAWEIALARGAVALGTPLLAICRGLQVLNVALGGTLIAHLPDVFGDALPHRNPFVDARGEPIGAVAEHDVMVMEETRLHEILGASVCRVASWHHQGIAELAPGMRVAARAADGVIEAIESPAHPGVLAVQWHPEITASGDPRQQRLFEALARMQIGGQCVRERRGNRPATAMGARPEP